MPFETGTKEKRVEIKNGTVPFKFTSKSSPYNAGDIAGFNLEGAKELERRGAGFLCDAKGERLHPLPAQPEESGKQLKETTAERKAREKAEREQKEQDEATEREEEAARLKKEGDNSKPKEGEGDAGDTSKPDGQAQGPGAKEDAANPKAPAAGKSGQGSGKK